MRTASGGKKEHGLAGLYRRLQEVDPITAGRLKANDSQRIERALEVYLLTGRPLSEHFTEQKQAASLLDLCTVRPYPRRPPFVTPANRKTLLSMLEHGFLDEIHALRRDYPQLHADMPSMRCVGYRQAWDYLEGETDYDTFVEKGIIATRQLAKRQLTWLRKIPLAHVRSLRRQRLCSNGLSLGASAFSGIIHADYATTAPKALTALKELGICTLEDLQGKSAQSTHFYC